MGSSGTGLINSGMADPAGHAVELVELRVLEGPNLYFTRPAIKLTLAMPGWLELPASRVEHEAERLKLSPAGPPGALATEHRRRYLARLAAHVTRSVAEASGSQVAVRGRIGPEPEQVVVAFPWRRQGAAEALGAEVARLIDTCLRDHRRIDTLIGESVERLQSADPGVAPSVPEPAIPVVAVTGTNGKTTTVRLLAHLARTAGKTVAYTSTDGVYRNQELKVPGDYSGFGGAAEALGQPGIDLAVLEVARGGILLRGIGAAHNDVAVVTNVSEDHLDQYGIRTLDQLAEVKASITHITRPDGWDILNADDPRVLSMSREARGRTWLFSVDHDHPAIRDTLAHRGRATTVIDGYLTAEFSRRDVRRLLKLEDIPVTLAGISTHNIRNAMAASSAALALGLSEEAVIRGLKSFVLDPERNPGRANLFELDGRIVLIDYAHNEDGMRGLVEICQGLRPANAQIWLAFGSAGDRTDAILKRVAYTAAKGSDHLAIAELHRYLRGRDAMDLLHRQRQGAAEAGVHEVPAFPDEIHALEWMLGQSKPPAVVAITALAQRPEIFALLEKRKATRMSPARVRELVRRARARATRG